MTQNDPAAFTRHVETSHEHERYAPICTRRLTVLEGFEARVEMANARGKRNKAVGPDGIHIGMLKEDSATCAKFLAVWWRTVGRLA